MDVAGFFQSSSDGAFGRMQLEPPTWRVIDSAVADGILCRYSNRLDDSIGNLVRWPSGALLILTIEIVFAELSLVLSDRYLFDCILSERSLDVHHTHSRFLFVIVNEASDLQIFSFATTIYSSSS